MRDFHFLYERHLLSYQGIIYHQFYSLLVGCSSISKEHHPLLIDKSSDGFIQFKVENRTIYIDPALIET